MARKSAVGLASTNEMVKLPITIIVPTFNESANIRELVERIEAATASIDFEIVFVDDSSDDTPEVISAVAASSSSSIRLLHRRNPVGGLGGAVIEGMKIARHDWVLVMDGDLQHPPEMIPVLVDTAFSTTAAIVVASRYRDLGSAGGLSNASRRAVSSLSTLLTRAMFPSRLRDCTDPMTGFFMVRRSGISTTNLEPRGFKILLEIIARQPSRVEIVEEPFSFGKRFAGESKASLMQGFHFLQQLVALRFGRASSFAVIGAVGAVLNVSITALLTLFGTHYLVAAAIAAIVTIIGNFFLQERFVFRDLTESAGTIGSRFAKSFTFNILEAALRIPLLYVLVDLWGIASVPATAMTLALAFVVRFVFHSRVVYGPAATSREFTLPDTAAQGSTSPAPLNNPAQD